MSVTSDKNSDEFTNEPEDTFSRSSYNYKTPSENIR